MDAEQKETCDETKSQSEAEISKVNETSPEPLRSMTVIGASDQKRRLVAVRSQSFDSTKRPKPRLRPYTRWEVLIDYFRNLDHEDKEATVDVFALSVGCLVGLSSYLILRRYYQE